MAPTINGAASVLLVIHDFLARSADELSLAKGDRVELIERDDDFGDGWYLGRLVEPLEILGRSLTLIL